MYIMYKYARDITLFRNMFLKNNYKLIKNNTKKTMIIINSNLRLTEIKVKSIPYKERYETIDF